MSEEQSPLGVVSMAATTLYVTSFEEAVSWYDSVLGLTPMMVGSDGHPYATFQIGRALVVLEPLEAAIDPAPPGSETTTINLVVDRAATMVREDLVSRGVACSEIVKSPSYNSFLFRDLDGNRFYVAQAVVEAAKAPTGR